jgi:hypothetical protein
MEPRIHELREDLALRKIPTASFEANAFRATLIQMNVIHAGSKR